MPIKVQCSGCGKNLKGPDNLAGKQVKCPVCGQLIQLPHLSPRPASPAEAPIDDTRCGGTAQHSVRNRETGDQPVGAADRAGIVPTPAQVNWESADNIESSPNKTAVSVPEPPIVHDNSAKQSRDVSEGQRASDEDRFSVRPHAADVRSSAQYYDKAPNQDVIRDQADPDIAVFLDVHQHTKVIAALSVALIILGIGTMVYASTTIGLPGMTYREALVDMPLFRVLLVITANSFYLTYGIFGLVWAANGRVQTNGFAGFMFFGIFAKSVREPKHVSLHLLGVIIIGTFFVWFFPVVYCLT